MPCGGIYSVTVQADQPCMVCEKGSADLFCEEWDGFLHRQCLGVFLASEEGAVVLAHGHAIDVAEEGFVVHQSVSRKDAGYGTVQPQARRDRARRG